ncbi:MAG: single-stranded DNA-binding protein [Thermotogota bacterium]
MSISYNKVILVGRLTADPQVSYASNGMMIAKFTLAVDRQFKRESQNSQDADFLRIVAFGKLAEFVNNYLSKGRLIMAEGRIQTSRFQGADGITKYFTDIIAEKLNFMETKKSAQEYDRKSGGSYDTSNRPFDNEEVVTNNEEIFDGPGESEDDEVPF